MLVDGDTQKGVLKSQVLFHGRRDQSFPKEER